MADLLTVFLDIRWLVLIINLFLGPITIITHTWEPPWYLWLNLRLTWNHKPKTQTGTFSWGTAWQVSVHHTATADVTLKKTEGHFDAAFIWLAEGSHENMWILERSWVSGHSAEQWDTWPTFYFLYAAQYEIHIICLFPVLLCHWAGSLKLVPACRSSIKPATSWSVV